MITNFLITGSKKIGKTTLIKKVYNTNKINPIGFITLPILKNNIRRGFYYHSLFNIQPNDLPIIYDMKTNPEVFMTLGVKTLKMVLKSNNNFVILDEIGRIEKSNECYIKLLNEIFDSNKFVLAALKKEDIIYINQIKVRKDVKIIDLDSDDFNESYKFLNNCLKEYRGEYNNEKNI